MTARSCASLHRAQHAAERGHRPQLRFSHGKEQRFLYVVDGSNKVIRVLTRTTLEQVSAIGGHAGHNAREFFHAHSFAGDSKGNVFIGEVNDGQRFTAMPSAG